jgi:hypothetical protein
VREVAEQIGIAPSTLVHMEQGKLPPHSKTLIAVWNWLVSEEANGTGKNQQSMVGVGPELRDAPDAVEGDL